MLREEAIWLGRQIHSHDPDAIFPQCDVGSSTGDMRDRDQPWIDQYVFKPARDNAKVVRFADLKPAPGVDLVGDVTSQPFIERLRGMGFRSIVCANVLEHVEDREKLANGLLAVLPKGGLLFVTCPYRFPIHPDPIDTGFRPTPDRLASLFSGTTVISKAVIGGGSYLRMLLANPSRFFQKSARTAGPLTTSSAWSRVAHHLPWLVREFQVSCVVLQK
jgi:hypothetical protein